VLVPSPPALNTAGASPLFVTVPLPASEPITLEFALRSKIPLTVKAELGLSAVREPARSVPAIIVVGPK
jgi:hypothetical protein